MVSVPVPVSVQERKEEAEQQYQAAAAELEQERALNAAHRLTGDLLEAVCSQKDAAIAVLEQAGGTGSDGSGNGNGGSQRQSQGWQVRVLCQLGGAAWRA